MRAVHALFLIATVSIVACDPEPPPLEPVEVVSASFLCSDDGTPQWQFVVSLAGPADEGSTTVFVETEDVPNPTGYRMTVQGGNGQSVAFETTVPGTPAGQDPAPGDVPFACDAADMVQVTYCATPEGRPSEEPCWACGDDSMGPPPGGTEDWIQCD